MKKNTFIILAFLILIVSQLQVLAARKEVDQLEGELAQVIEYTADVARETRRALQLQDHKIELYEQHCADTARCIIEGVW